MSRLTVWTAALAVCWLPCRLADAQEVAARIESPAAQAAQASNEALEAVLRQPTRFEFEETSLTDAIGFLADKHDVDIAFDVKALSDLALDPAVAVVTRTLRKPISLAAALHVILRDFDLTHVVRDETILITSQSEAEESLATKVYQAGDLLSGTGKGRATTDQLMEAITGTVAADTWAETGGSATIAPLGNLFIVTQTHDRHGEIARLLAALRGAIEGHDEENAAKAAEAEPEKANAEVAAELRQPTAFEFADTPLSDAVEFLAKKHDLEIQFDNKALADLSLDPGVTPITLSVGRPTPLRSALERMLRPLDLTWMVRDEVLWITSATEAMEWTVTKVYPVDDLLNAAAAPPWSADDLLAAIATSIQPDSWNERGGPGAIARVGHMLVVAQNREGHEKLSHLLTQLRAALSKDAGEAASAARDERSDGAPTTGEELKIVEYPLQFLSGDEAAKALTALIAPETWQANGGAGAACTVVTTTKADMAPNRPPAQSQTLLVVRQTPTVHKQIRRLLGKLDRSPNSGFGGGGFGGGGGGGFF
ncbi:MAG: hypothetical protein HYX69_04300 [Planctomycetia bacterium]|nr:hypothetical protein [Planctomycetia bacterium]